VLSPLAVGAVTGLVSGGGAWAATVAARRLAARDALARLGRAGRGRPLPAPTLVAEALAAAGLGLDPGRGTWLWVGGTVAAGVLGAALAGPAVGLVAAIGAGVAPVVAARSAAARQVRRADDQLPVLLDQVARSLRGGASLHLALADAAGTVEPPLRHELAHVQGEVAAGATLVAALDRWAGRCPRRPVRLVVAALASCAEQGGAGARAVDGVAASLRATAAVAAEARALASQARYSALVIALAPVAFSILAVGADPRTAGFLLHSAPGQACLVAGLALDATGAWWMQRIVGAAR
jgi:tight adherence protein B